MLIEQKGWEFDFSLDGGRIVSLKKDGKYILNTFDRENGKIGRTHLCVPNFGNEFPEYELPFHGSSRDKLWELISYDSGKSAEIIYKMINEGKYLTDLTISQYFELGDKFVHRIKIENIGKKEAKINLAIHYYFNLNPKKLKINGEDVSGLVVSDKDISVYKINNITDGKQQIEMNLCRFPQRRVHLWSGTNDSCCVEPVMGARTISPKQIITGVIELK